MYILGLNAFHADSSACILKDGKLITALEEERLRRVKHWAGFPEQAISYCLKEAGISMEDVHHITVSRNPYAHILKKIVHTVRNKVNPKSVADRLSNLKKITSVKLIWNRNIKEGGKKMTAKVHNIEHHRSHLASAFFASPFENAALLSIDGFGDFCSTMTGTGSGNRITVDNKVFFPHSLGIFYTSFTQFLGFKKYGDEYKVMGLAPYGKPEYLDSFRDVIRLTGDGLFELNLNYFRHHKEGVSMTWEGGEPQLGELFSDYCVKKFGKAREEGESLTDRHKALAASVQNVCEEVIIHILNHLYKRYPQSNLCVAGGVAQNSVANGKITSLTPFKKVYIPPAGHDAGTGIGSALYLYNQVLGKPRMPPMNTAALGSRYDSAAIEKILSVKKIPFKRYGDEELYNLVTDSIINGGVVGWFQGRAEFGPRALGHRSILADPRRKDAKDILNLKIKRRESFRPFAPSILKEHVSDYFEFSDSVPFMEKVFLVKSNMRERIPAVTHVDGTGRLQTVNAATEPRFHALINCFYKKTGVPVLLNTSFNENEPIVNTPGEAIDCFIRTKMDMLVLEDLVVER